MMKQRLIGLLQGLLAMSLTIGMMHAHSQKTFFAPRPVGMNKAMEFTSWDNFLYDFAETNNCLHGRFSSASFFQHSTNRAGLGEYFGIGNGTNTFSVGQRWNLPLAGGPVTNSTTLVANAAEVDGQLLSGNGSFQGNVTFKPYQQIWGSVVGLQYFHNPLQGMYVGVSMPLVSVTNTMGMSIHDDQLVTIAIRGAQKQYTLADYLAGDIKIDDDFENMRAPLCKSKINCKKHTTTGIADIDVVMGYRNHKQDRRRLDASVRFTIPTGGRGSGEYLFEPVAGNGHHIGLGFNLDSGFKAWHGQAGQLWFDAGMRYSYLFEGDEVRMLGIKNLSPQPKLAQYILMGKVKGLDYQAVASDEVSSYSHQAIFPAANELTRLVSVTPGSHIELLFAGSFVMEKFAINLGYNMFWRDREDVEVKNWTDDVYGLFGNQFNTNDSVSVTQGTSDALFFNNSYVNSGDLDVCPATTPDQLSHKVFAGVTYRHASFLKCCPMSHSLNASYEFGSNNAALDQYAIWFKSSLVW